MPIDPRLTALPTDCVHGRLKTQGNYVIENNDWAAFRAGATHQQCIYTGSSTSSSPQFGWSWNAVTPTGRVMAYPEVIYGKKPWAGGTTVAGLPCPLGLTVPSLSVTFNTSTVASGRYNAAFEVWLTSTQEAIENDETNRHDITHEVMWWVGQQDGPQPAGRIDRSGLRFPDGRTCDLYIARPGSDWWQERWVYFAFVFDSSVPSGTLECGYYLHYLMQRGLIPPTQYIASLEFGNEIWTGEGYTLVESYRVELAAGLDVTEVVVDAIEAGGTATGDTTTTGGGSTEARDTTRAYILLRVPEGASVFVEGVPTQSTSTERIFMSPPIDQPWEEKEYVYTVRVVYASGREEERDVSVWAGYEVTEEFRDA